MSILVRRCFSNLSFLLTLWLISGCATGVYHDRQLGDANYYSGHTGPIVYPQIRIVPSQKDIPDNRLAPPPGSATEDTVISLVSSALSLAQNPDYYKKSTVGGRCLYEAPIGSTLEIPCLNVTVTLSDFQGHEINRFNSSNGDFEFFVEKNKDYRLSVVSEKYAMATQDIGPVSMGDDVIIRLFPKRRSAQAD